MIFQTSTGLCIDLSELAAITGYNDQGDSYSMALKNGMNLQIAAIPPDAGVISDSVRQEKGMKTRQDWEELTQAWKMFKAADTPEQLQQIQEGLERVEKLGQEMHALAIEQDELLAVYPVGSHTRMPVAEEMAKRFQKPLQGTDFDNKSPYTDLNEAILERIQDIATQLKEMTKL